MVSSGDLLIAPPRMRDPRFRKSVMLVTQVGLQGVQAMCVNRPMNRSVNEVIEDLDRHLDEDHVLYWGGPVANHTLWFLHSSEWIDHNTLPMNEHWSVTSSTNMLATLNTANKPEYGRFCLGMAAWAPGQLENEMESDGPWPAESSWLTAQSPSPETLFHIPPEDIWEWACTRSAEQAVKHWF